jgi:hypothetical protein
VLVGDAVYDAHTMCAADATKDIEDLFALKIMESGEVDVHFQMLTQIRQLG